MKVKRKKLIRMSLVATSREGDCEKIWRPDVRKDDIPAPRKGAGMMHTTVITKTWMEFLGFANLLKASSILLCPQTHHGREVREDEKPIEDQIPP